jgi:hypothetical protein
MPKYQYKIGPEKEGHILNGNRLFVGAVIESDVPLVGEGFSLVEGKATSISNPAPDFAEPSASISHDKPRKGKE